MKKLFSALLSLGLFLLLFSGAALAEEPSLEAVAAANTRQALLENCRSVSFEISLPGQEPRRYVVTADYFYDEGSATLFDAADSWHVVSGDGADHLCLDWYAMGEEERAAVLPDYKAFFPLPDAEALRAFTLTDTADNGDGTLTLTAFAGPAAYPALTGEDGEERTGTELLLTVDADTLALRSLEEYALTDGGRVLSSGLSAAFDAPLPEKLLWMLGETEVFRAGAGQEEPRTLTVIYDAGRNREESFSLTVGRRFKVLPVFRTGYDYLYADPGRAVVFAGGDGVRDVTIYAFNDLELDGTASLEIARGVIERSRPEVLPSAHASVTLRCTHGAGAPDTTLSFFTPDCVYTEYGAETAEYARGRLVYRADLAGEGAPCLCALLLPDPVPLSRLLPETWEAFHDAAHERVERAWIEAGEFHLLTVADAERSRSLTEDLGAEYGGGVLATELTADAYSGELISYERVLRQDGSRRVLERVCAAFDEAEPAAARVLCAAFERPAEKRMRVTLVADPGTGRERSESVSVPVNTEVRIGADASAVYFDDARASCLSHWDRMHDRTFYLFTAPSPELSARFSLLRERVLALLEQGEEEAEAAVFLYEHDPALNPTAMADIVRDDSAVYGYRPSETGSLRQYAPADWSDPETVEKGRLDRIAYHESLSAMYARLDELQAEGRDIEDIARTLSRMRNELRLAAHEGDPEGLATVKARNLETYGHEEGPLPEELYEKYGSWEAVLEKAFTLNAGMDACLGLYDEYYPLYVLAGQTD